MKVWVDLSNSPHPLLFEPVARLLGERGHEVLLTARDNAQTVELARERWPHVEVIGGETPPGVPAKGRALAARVRTLARWARSHGADVALSHNSYAQVLAARGMGLPIVTAMDFEHQPANHLAFRLAGTVLLPEALREVPLYRQGASDRKTSYYPGLKEEVYLGECSYDDDVLSGLGIEREPGAPLVVARTPPSRATYHRFGNPLFLSALAAVAANPAARVVVLVRHRDERAAVEELGLENITVPDRAVDSRSLMRVADLVLGAGGTMTREAALLGAPTYSLFAGEQPAVDRWLESQGRLHRLEDASQLEGLEVRQGGPADVGSLRARGEELSGLFVEAVERAASGGKRARSRGGRIRGSVELPVGQHE